ncbi:flagellar basal body rod protein FlgB [Mesobacillus foraminis]|uniref:flagellar basal body rod protein FlgB n=1 Tax=Mesobacillus foraminis TaxID=279826 RepID=UPI001BE73C6A|nr:flagellar basal body rod protein FlgB [Mesobacillus foraminis]MBT2756021.1 flagellar basal body rod protein FlgB [Mesobacillus foraminis]
MSLFSGTISNLESAMNYSSMKQKVISQNIANVDTPNYKAKDVSFRSSLQMAVNAQFEGRRTDSRHFNFQGNAGSGAAVKIRNAAYNHNGNGVDMDKEMADLATNQIYYNALTERINGKFNTLQTVIKGGK